MTRRRLWRISLTTTAEAGDAVAEMLSHVIGASPSTYTDAETGTTTVSVYCERRPPRLEAKRTALRAGLRGIKSCGLDIGSDRVRVQVIPHEDWAESWKRHFHPIEIGNTLLVKPSWSRRRPRAGQATVVLDPGLSFGTGQHPTTEFCLRELVRSRGAFRSLLDIGTGSGILAIAAAKLGYSPVHAFDVDPQCVRVTHSNARLNCVRDKIRLTLADLASLPRHRARRYDVVCANLLANLLISERERIVARVKPGGLLVLAGILKREFAEVRRAYNAAGLRLMGSKSESEWKSGSFVAS